MPGYSRFTSTGQWTPRIPSTYDGFVSVQNLTWPERVIRVHTVGPEGSIDFDCAGYGEYLEIPLRLVVEFTMYALDDPDAGVFTAGLLFTSQRVRYGLRKNGWIGAILAAGGTPGGSGTPGGGGHGGGGHGGPGGNASLYDDFNRADQNGLGVAVTGQVWTPPPYAGVIVSGHALFSGGDNSNDQVSVAAGYLPVPCVLAVNVLSGPHTDIGRAGCRITLNDGWYAEWIADLITMTETLTLFHNATARVPSVSVSGSAVAPPFTIGGSMRRNVLTFGNLVLPVPSGLTISGAADFTLVAATTGYPVVFSKISVVGV